MLQAGLKNEKKEERQVIKEVLGRKIKKGMTRYPFSSENGTINSLSL